MELCALRRVSPGNHASTPLHLPCRRAAEAAHGPETPPSCPIPHPCPGQRAPSAAKQQKRDLQVPHVGDAAERLPRDPQDLVFAQVSKREDKRHRVLARRPALSASHYDNKTPWRLFGGLFSLRPQAAASLHIVPPAMAFAEMVTRREQPATGAGSVGGLTPPGHEPSR